MSELKKLLGKRIQKIRKIRGFTQDKLSEMIGIEVPSLSNIETGKFAPAIDTLEKIAQALNVEMSEFYHFNNITHEKMIQEMNSKFVHKKKLTKITYNFVKSIEYEIQD